MPASEESSNWSGYEDSGPGAHFTRVSASWDVPTLEPNITGSSSTWVGIDGTNTPDLIQVGTEQDWTVSGPLYYAWYELLPSTAINLGPVQPGDHVTAEIDQVSPGKWTVSIDDATSRADWTEHVVYNAPGTSAEWVVEAPSSGPTNAVEPLAAFGSVTFSDMSATGTGTGGSLAAPVFL
ncbi:MAG TPA: G1 family glutamic endopeptidase, partial [Acidimicrobiales bacterium]|nr:G1 family glutamic endopeptidase [Acidimicrobiales bacterium]